MVVLVFPLLPYQTVTYLNPHVFPFVHFSSCWRGKGKCSKRLSSA